MNEESSNIPTSTPQRASMRSCPKSKPGQISTASTRSKSRCRSLPRSARKPGFPISGTLRLIYTPAERCLELKSLKMYTLAYRNLGIFQENVVNRLLADVVQSGGSGGGDGGWGFCGARRNFHARYRYLQAQNKVDDAGSPFG